MKWQPLISRWRMEADRREAQFHAARGTGNTFHRVEEAAIIATLRKCAAQAEKSLRRQQLREHKEQHVQVGKMVFPQGSKFGNTER